MITAVDIDDWYRTFFSYGTTGKILRTKRNEMAYFNSMFLPTVILSMLCIAFHTSLAVNKYSAKANEPKYADSLQFPNSLRELDKPFRMAKLNLLWVKAKNRLTDTELRSIFSDLKIHDKEELAYKHMKAEGKDPYGEEEAQLRKKLLGIMSTYGILKRFEDTKDDPMLTQGKASSNDGKRSNYYYVGRDVFNDTRLNELWAKAEIAGFTHEELEALKEEFRHHQDKVDEYTNLLQDMEAGGDSGRNTEPSYKNSLYEKPVSWNEIDTKEEEDASFKTNKNDEGLDRLEKATLLREKRLELRNGYDRLDKLAGKGPNHKQFVEPKVQGLWRIVLEADFSPEERASLKEELTHYEGRLLKLRHYHTEAALEAARRGKQFELENSTLEQQIKKHARHVEKLRADLEAKIIQRHTEL